MQYPAGQWMKGMGIRGIIRDKPHKTTIADNKALYPCDKVNHHSASLHRISLGSANSPASLPGERSSMWLVSSTPKRTVFGCPTLDPLEPLVAWA